MIRLLFHFGRGNKVKTAFFVIRRAKQPEETDKFSEIFSNKDYWIEIYCPECNGVHPGTEFYEKHKEYNYDVLKRIKCSNCNTFFDSNHIKRLYYKNLNIFHVHTDVYINEHKVAISSFFNLIDIFNKNLVIKNINTRLVLNIETGQTYFLAPIDTKTKKKFVHYKYGQKYTYPSIKNITLRNIPEFYYYMPDEIKEEVTNIVYNEIEKYHGFKLHPERKHCGIQEINLANRFPRLSRWEVGELDSMFIRLRGNGTEATHRLLSNVRPYHDGKDVTGIMLKIFNIPRKRKLIKLIAENWALAVTYHHVRMWGIKNYDNILTILEARKDYRYPLDEISSIVHVKNFKDKHLTPEAFFIRKLLSIVSERKVVNMILNHYYDFFDAAKMYYDLCEYEDDLSIKSTLEDERFFKRKIKTIHDDLMYLHMQMQQKNIPIKYSQEQKNLQGKIDGYEFSLPKDTDEIRLIGFKMHHCVGSYANRVLKKQTTIVSVRKNNKYVVCIEVDQDLKGIYQAKREYNKQVSGELANTLKKWLKMHNIENRSHDIV